MVLVGPTASGKTALSLELAALGFEIISADSVQVYRYLDIGSGKPTVEERSAARHFCIDIVDPDYNFTAGEFCRFADSAAGVIAREGKIPLFVGGTGLYIDSYFFGLSEIPPVGESVRQALFHELQNRGIASLYRELAECDPVFASRIHPNDRQRILRGLEVFRQSGRPLSSFFGNTVRRISENTVFIGLRVERNDLRARISRRVDAMMRSGLVEEVESLRGRGYGPDLKSMKSIGYAEVNLFLDGHIEKSELAEKIKINTARYAKRQMTWFGKNNLIQWVAPEEKSKIFDIVLKWKETVG